MSILAIGGAGFIGRRLIPLLAARGEHVTCMDIDVAGAKAAFADLGDAVEVIRGDVTQFDDVVGATLASKAERVVNLSYFIGDLDPHVAFKLDIQGMDNCFEAARIAALVKAAPEAPLQELRGTLCESIREGSLGLEDDGLQQHLRHTVVARILIDQPRYSGLREARRLAEETPS